MNWKKLPFSEQLSYGISSKRKVFSGFGLGVGSSILILSLIFLYCPVKISLFNPVFQGFSSISGNSSWPFSFSSTSNSSLELQKSTEESVQEKTTNQGSLLKGSGNANVSDFDGGKMGTAKTHEGNFSEGSQNASFFGFNGGKNTHEGNFTEQKKNKSLVSEGVGEKTHMGSLAADVKNVSISGKEQPIEDKSTEGKSTEREKKEGFGGREKRVREKTHEEIHKGNFSEKDKNASSYNESGISKGNSSEKDKNASSYNESGISKGNVSEKDKIASSYNESGNLKGLPDLSGKCNIFQGRWVKDEKKPYYPAGSCPLIDRDFDCHLNGRPDDDFLRWRWQPNDCNIPSLNATDFLERLRGKRLIFVGDSLNRNMWESLVCMLRHGVKNKSRVHERSGRRQFKVQGFYSFRYEDYNCSVEFVSAPFLVRESSVKGQNGTVETLRLDLMDKTTSAYREADVIVFNTGHWWTHEKTSKGENYYQEGTHVYQKLKVLDAFKRALVTWARWVDKNIDTNRTQVFFRGYSVTHFRGGQWNSGGQCHKETEPIFNETYLAKYPSKMKVLETVLQQMKTPIVYLNISKLTDYRKDGHPSIYRMEYKTEEERAAAVTAQDCSHWCLPGVPDTWNELLYASLLKGGRGSWKN